MEFSVLESVTQAFPTLGGRTAPAPRVRRGRRRLKWFQWFVDDAIRIPGTELRLGGDAVLGLLPVAGDVLSALLQSYLLLEALHLGVDARTLLRMAANVVIDLMIGLLPVIGDVWDMTFRATRRNVGLLLEHLEAQASAAA